MSPEPSPQPIAPEGSRPHRAAAAIALAWMMFALAMPAMTAGADGEITSEGPLTRIITSVDLNCQVAHRDDLRLEFFPGDVPGACGTFLSIGDELLGPAVVPAGGGIGSTPWTPVRQDAVTGSGGGGDPFRLVTVVDAGELGVRVEQTDSYRVGEESYRTDIRISNDGPADRRAIVYRAGDCFLQDSDTGFGRVDDGAPGCVISQESDARIEQWVPITPGSHHFEGQFGEVWARIGSQEPFPDQCLCDQAVDNAAGLSWEVVIPAGGSIEVSHLTFFSPQGRQATTTLRDSVPGPLDVNLDPVVLASSAAIAAGVVLFVPFPAALFNSTLEQHYAEVMSAVGRLRAWLGRLLAGAWTRGRRAVADARSPSSGAAADGDPGLPPPAPNVTAAAPRAKNEPEPDERSGFALDEAFWRSPLGILAFIAVSALLYGLLDPTFGFSLDSVATFLGLALGLVVMVLAFAVPQFIGARRQGIAVAAQALPGTLLVAVGCVLISRIAEFQPGYLYGLIIGFTFSRALSKPDAGKLEAIAAGVSLALALIAWVLLPIVRGSGVAEGQAFTATLLETACATVVVAGLEAAAIAMLPLRFLPGERVRAWNQRVWAGLLGVAAFGFAHVLLNPQSGYLADSTRTSLFTVVLLLVAFGAGSVLFWAYFRFRRQPGADAAPPPPMPSAEPPTG